MEKKIFEPMYPAELYTSRPNETALLSPIYDYTFKGIFTQETEESDLALKSFLSAVLNRRITQVTIKSNEPLKETKKQKTMTFDICVQFDNGEISAFCTVIKSLQSTGQVDESLKTLENNIEREQIGVNKRRCVILENKTMMYVMMIAFDILGVILYCIIMKLLEMQIAF